MTTTKNVTKKPVTKRRVKKPTTNKKAETKAKVDKLFEGLPLGIGKEGIKPEEVVKEKPKEKDHDAEWLADQVDDSTERIKELEDEVIKYKSAYEKLLNKSGASSIVTDESLVKLQNMFTEMVQVRNKQGLKSNIILDYTGTGPQGLLQQLQAIFPFLK